ncbi:MAG: MarR family transcriptional regulator [Clostridiales bacterium]|nr:MarR family transcriptional regulator [Clostridiales bacterium]
MKYILEVKQIVDYPRVRIYREFIQTLINHKDLSVRGNCNLFNYIVLCCYANYCTSKKTIDGKKHLIAPGQWLCSIKDLMKWFNQTKVKSLAVLESLQRLGVIEYELLKEYVFYKIIDWDKDNSFMEYESQCQKDDGFFFFPFDFIDRFLRQGEKCSEKDILMDLWLNTIYNDNRVDGSQIGPVVYFRNETGNPRTSYSFMAARWNTSKATVCRLLDKLQEYDYITYLNFSGRYGSVIYLNGYMSLMFRVSDVPIDKKEVALALKLKIEVEEEIEENIVSDEEIIVSKSGLKIIEEKLKETLNLSGFGCAVCKASSSLLYRLSLDCTMYMFKVLCKKGKEYKFLTKIRRENSG